MIDAIYKSVIAAFKRKSDRMAEIANPIIKSIVEERNGKGLIRVPVSDGKRTYGITVDIEEAYNTESKSIVRAWQKAVLLMTIDDSWKEHLRELDQLRQSVQNASYEQKDPLLIYKLESFNMFKEMVNNLNTKAISILMRGQIPIQENTQVQEATPERRQDYSKYRTQKEQYPGENAQRSAASQRQGEHARPEPIKVGPKVGRNDPCPCGSGKKFKNCHGKDA